MNSKSWHKSWSLAYLCFGWHVYKHEYYDSSSRWVLQPFLTYDAIRLRR